MDSQVLVMMLGASLILGSVALISFLWAIKNNHLPVLKNEIIELIKPYSAKLK